MSTRKESTSLPHLQPTTINGSTISQPQQQSHSEASAITLLLADHESFGFGERACYHFDLIETLTQIPQQQQRSNSSRHSSRNSSIDFEEKSIQKEPHEQKDVDQEEEIKEQSNEKNKYNDQFPKKIPSICGVVSILECIHQNPLTKTKRRRLIGEVEERLIGKVEEFNREADEIRKSATTLNKNGSSSSEQKDFCYQPNALPLRLNFDTRVSFAYELTRMVFCIDASPTLTATFGNFGIRSGDQGPLKNNGTICAIDRIEHMARLFFNGLVQPIKGMSKFDARDTSKVPTNSGNLNWFPRITVTVVACYPKSLLLGDDKEKISILVSDYHIHDVKSANKLCDRIAAWVAMEVESTIAQKFSRTGGRLESTTSSLEEIIDTCHAVDTATLPPHARPCFVIATDCRAIDCASVMDLVKVQNLDDVPLHVIDLSCGRTNFQKQKIRSSDLDMMFDYDGPSSFPLSISDDYEALFNACRCTRGYFFDTELLELATTTIAGEVPSDSPYLADFYFSATKRRNFKPNALQWYISFTLSPLCQHRGLPPLPNYFRPRKDLQREPDKVTCLIYKLEPIRIKSVLILRIMDGFRTWKYGTDSKHKDRVSVQFDLRVEGGTVIRYKIEYKSSRFHNAMVGNANVKIFLLGEITFIEMVRKQLDPSFKKSVASAKDLALNKICAFMKDIKDEDLRESKICPLEWDDNLSDDSEFLPIFSKFNSSIIYRHFRCERFEIIMTQDSEHSNGASNEKKLIELISNWSTETITANKLYFKGIKRLPIIAPKLTNYCLVECKKPNSDLRVYEISMHFFEQIDVTYRLKYVSLLKQYLEAHATKFILSPRIVSKYINEMPLKSSQPTYNDYSNILQSEGWELLSDPELFPLITQQRSEVDLFCPVLVLKDQIIFIKFVTDSSSHLCLIQYSIKAQGERVHVSLSMDNNKADFSLAFSRFNVSKSPTLFSNIYETLMERDQRCARILRSRRQLLNLFNVKNVEPPLITIDQSENVDRLLSCAEKHPIKLRFFDEASAKANEILEKLTMNFILSESFHAEVTELSVVKSKFLQKPGKWFLLRTDEETLYLLHFPLQELSKHPDTDSHSIRFIEITMFVISTMQLYSPNDSTVKPLKSQNPEYPEKILLLNQQICKAHGRNFSLASYLAFRDSNSELEITVADFDHVLSYCKDIPIIFDVEIMSSFEIDVEYRSFGEKLVTLIMEILTPVPIKGKFSDKAYFYFDSTINQDYEVDDQLYSSIDKTSETGLKEISEMHYNEPIYISFTIDGKAASLEGLCNISSQEKQSSILNAFITTFDDRFKEEDYETNSAQLPRIQDAVAKNLIMKLNSFVAEQTMERLRMERKVTNSVDFEHVRNCLLEAENVVVSTIPVHFYFSEADTMIDASTSIGMEEDFQQKFTILNSCISNQKSIPFTEVLVGEFFADDIEEFGWCFLHVPESFGFVSIYCYHPAGIDRADEVAMAALKVISDANHCANQTLLLEHMHRTRTASALMIPEHIVEQPKKENPFSFRAQESNILDYPPGYFQCDVSFQTSFTLNRRCQVSSVIIDLESSVLHSFALLNRRREFVYKDEDECIFYMKLEKGKVHDVDTVKFFVYGIRKAGPSITVQLSGLLQRKLMTLCTEAISRVLTKNPKFHLLDSDLQFIRDYRKNLKGLTDNNDNDSKCEQIYAFPSNVRDPVMILVYFRQNIIGSTFFNYVSATEQKDFTSKTKISYGNESGNDSMDGVPFDFDLREFTFYYNASQFSPGTFQPISTITEAGKQFSRKAGTGVALIELQLLDSNKQPMKGFKIGVSSKGQKTPTDTQLIKVLRTQEQDLIQPISNFYLSVRIINTTLNTDAIHNWIELTLNQALSSFETELLLQRSMTLSPVLAKGNMITFGKLMRQCFELPHPASEKVSFNGNMKSSVLAQLVLKFLEHIMYTILGGKRYNINDIHGLQTMLCRGKQLYPVYLLSKSRQSDVHVFNSVTNDLIPEDPGMDAQFVSSFGLCHENTANDSRKKLSLQIPDSSLLFQKVRLFANDSGPLSNALKKLMKSNPRAFLRRIAFLLVVTRTSTTFYFYNWNPQALERVKVILTDTFNEFNETPKPTGRTGKEPKTSPEGSAATKNNQQSTSSKSSTSILMPRIVGKSDKGSVMKAVVMSRARASRTNSSRPVIAGKSGKSLDTTNRPVQRIMHKSTWKARHKKKAPEPKKKQEDPTKYLPPSLAKEYITLQSSLLKSSNNTEISSKTYQQFFASRLSKLKDKELSLQCIHFILEHANLVKVQTFLLAQAMLNHPHQLLTYLIKVVLCQDKQSTLLAKNFTWDDTLKNKLDRIPVPAFYVMRSTNTLSIQQSMIEIYEISILTHRKIGKVCRYRSWSLFSCDKAKDVFRSMFKYALTGNLNIKGEIFRCACARFVRSLKHPVENLNMNISSILRESYRIFPSHLQKKTRIGNWFRQYQYRLVVMKEKRDPIHDFSSADHLVNYVSHYTSHYEVVNIRYGMTNCIGGKVVGGEEYEAFFFLVPCCNNDGAIIFDLFVIVSAVNNILNLEKVFLEKKSNYLYTKNVKTFIVEECKKTVLSIINMASVDFRRDQMWVEQSDWI